ncbi:hypothetical protein LINPERHAP1_LOCUS27793 [Linum perenne]
MQISIGAIAHLFARSRSGVVEIGRFIFPTCLERPIG